ncbi:proteophosphoglycan 5 [Streptomyces sp. NPDC005752]|uniref:proteophosphoglycan 5 n=1 Tax=Streptomyces sp. NPDC005752 TaxID=3157065 RepID=UPI0033D0F6CE
MSLVQLDLPHPTVMRGRWAALAAVQAAAGHGEQCRALWPLWHYDDGHGSWADLHHLDEGHAVLLGQDRNDSETFYAEASDFFEEPETDLLAGAPDWWEPPVRRVREAQLFLGFVYGFDGNIWQRAEYDLEDGFESVRLPALSTERTREAVLETARQTIGRGIPEPSQACVDALIAADAAVDPSQVAAVVDTGWDADVGAAAACAFRAG